MSITLYPDRGRTAQKKGRHSDKPVAFYSKRSIEDQIGDHPWADHIPYIVHIIFFATIRHPKRMKDKREYASIHAETLGNIIGKATYRKVLDEAIRLGLIEEDRQYIPGMKTRGYRLTDEHFASEWQRIPISNGWIIRQFKKWRQVRNKKGRHSPITNRLAKNLQRAKVAIGKKEWAGLTDDERMFLELLADPYGLYWSLDRYGRFHHNLSGLKKTLRRYVKVRGRHLVSVDIANSQPLFFCLLMMGIFSKQSRLSSSFLSSSILSSGYDSTFEIDLFQTGAWYRLKSTQDFIAKCQSGTIYKHFRERAGLTELPDKEFKEAFFTMFYGANGPKDHLFHTVMKKDFPKVARFIRLYKRGNYKRLARHMQSVEAQFMLDIVCRRLLKEHPKVWIITVHDCIQTTTGNEEIVHRVMSEELIRLAMPATIRIKPENSNE